MNGIDADPQSDAQDVLIVVPTLNEVEQIEPVISTLLAGAPASARLAVTDGGSTDGTLRIVARIAARDRRVHLVHNPKRIQSAGINAAVREVSGASGLLLRADAHARYPPDYCRTLMAEMARSGAASVTVAMRSEGPGGFQAGVAAAQNSRLGTGGSAHRSAARGGRFVDHGHHALMRLVDFCAIGGYDETLSHNEDADLDHRLRAAGGRIWLAGAPVIGYLPRRTVGALFRQYRSYGAGRAAMLAKHRLRPRPRQALPLATVAAVLLALAGLLLAPLDARGLWMGLPALLWAVGCLGYGLVLGARARSAAVAWAGPAAIIIHLAWALGFLGYLARRR